jgi:hypothetical protein
MLPAFRILYDDETKQLIGLDAQLANLSSIKMPAHHSIRALDAAYFVELETS